MAEHGESPAIFRADQTFTLAARGRVLVGKIVSGKIKVVMVASLPHGADFVKAKIRGGEFLDNLAARVFKIGLWFDDAVMPSSAAWEAIACNRTEFSILDAK